MGPGVAKPTSRDQPAPVIGEQQHRVLARVRDRDIAARGRHRHGAAQDTHGTRLRLGETR